MDRAMYTASEALARLKAGNERFVRGRARFPTVRKEVLAALAKGQQPYATIIGCSDSRVPPELLFDAGFGELFIVRVAGNVISPEVMGTLQYAAVHLHTPLFIVLGHEGCGAVQAALAAKFEGARELRRIALLLKRILPGLQGLRPGRGADEGRGRSERALVDAAAARNAGGQGAHGRRRPEVGRRGVRTEDRPRQVPLGNAIAMFPGAPALRAGQPLEQPPATGRQQVAPRYRLAP